MYVPERKCGSLYDLVSGCHRWPRNLLQIPTHHSFSKLHSASNSDFSHPTLTVVLHHPVHSSHCHHTKWSSSLSLSSSEISVRKLYFGVGISRDFGRPFRGRGEWWRGRYLTGVLTTAVPAPRHWRGNGRGPMKMMMMMRWRGKPLQLGWPILILLGAPFATVPAS